MQITTEPSFEHDVEGKDNELHETRALTNTRSGPDWESLKVNYLYYATIKKTTKRALNRISPTVQRFDNR